MSDLTSQVKQQSLPSQVRCGASVYLSGASEKKEPQLSDSASVLWRDSSVPGGTRCLAPLRVLLLKQTHRQTLFALKASTSLQHVGMFCSSQATLC